MENIKFRIRNYKTGDYPVIEEKGIPQEFFIIKTGRVLRSTNHLPLHYSMEEELTSGDFFGVISCMSRRPNLHTIRILENTELIEVKRDEFRNLIVQNSPSAMKIIRYYSRKLRYCNNIFTKLSFKVNQSPDASLLFHVGEYFFTHQKQGHHAVYAYRKFLEYFPHDPRSAMVKERLALITTHFQDSKRVVTNDIYSLYDDDCVIFLEQEKGDGLFVIKEGEVRITKIYNNQEVLLSILKSGDIFGEMSILENKPRNANAFANGPVTLMKIDADNFDFMVKKYPELATRIIELLSDRIWFLHQHIFTILVNDPISRVYYALYIHLERDRVDLEQGGSYQFDFSLDDLIQFCGLNQFQALQVYEYFIHQENVIKIHGDHIYCENIRLLVERKRIMRKTAVIPSIPV